MITLSKQIDHTEIQKIYKTLVNKKEFKESIYNIIKNNIKDKNNEVIVLNEVLKLLNNNGYTIENINPLKIKEI